VVRVVVGSEDEGTGDEAEPEVDDAGDEAETEEEEDVAEVTVPDEVADRALALLLRCHRPDTREAMARQGRALALLERYAPPAPPPGTFTAIYITAPRGPC